jgi:hypothetical protein
MDLDASALLTKNASQTNVFNSLVSATVQTNYHHSKLMDVLAPLDKAVLLDSAKEEDNSIAHLLAQTVMPLANSVINVSALLTRNVLLIIALITYALLTVLPTKLMAITPISVTVLLMMNVLLILAVQIANVCHHAH